MRVVGSAAQPVGVALEAGVAPQRRAEAARGGSTAAVARRARLAAARPLPDAAAALGGAGAEHEAFAERVRGQPVGAVQARAGALADREQARQRRAPVEVGRDPAHHVVRRRRDRDQLALGVDSGPPQRADDVREQRRVDVAHVEPDGSRAGPVDRPLDRARDLVARRELVDEPLAERVEQARALAADRLGDEEPVGPVGRPRARRPASPFRAAPTSSGSPTTAVG